MSRRGNRKQVLLDDVFFPRPLTQALCQRQVRAITYETITDKYHRLPLYQPMSVVAGRMAMQAAAMAPTSWWQGTANGGGAGCSAGQCGFADNEYRRYWVALFYLSSRYW